jgi:hypothetical protein
VPLEEPVLPVCRQCVNDFGEPGSPQWCVCCKYDCNKARDACTNSNGFCRSRCRRRRGHFLPNTDAGAVPAPVFAPVSTRPILPPDNNHPIEETDDDDSDSKEEEEEEEEDDDEKSKSSKSSHHHHEPAKAPKAPETTTTVATTTTTTTTTKAAETTTTVLEHFADTGVPANDLLHANTTLTLGALLFAALIVVVVVYRKRTQQKPIDMGHVA